MSEKNWTPEPWERGPDDKNEQPTIEGPQGELIAVFAHECIKVRLEEAANSADRTISCVNALAAVGNPEGLHKLIWEAREAIRALKDYGRIYNDKDARTDAATLQHALDACRIDLDALREQVGEKR